MGAYQTKEAIEQNLRDAGCEEGCIREFMRDLEQDRMQAGVRLLNQHRRLLLDAMHREQKRIDCLDYLLYQIRKNNIWLRKENTDMKEIIENKTFDMERTLYNSDGLLLKNCRFDGPADGEMIDTDLALKSPRWRPRWPPSVLIVPGCGPDRWAGRSSLRWGWDCCQRKNVQIHLKPSTLKEWNCSCPPSRWASPTRRQFWPSCSHSPGLDWMKEWDRWMERSW